MKTFELHRDVDETGISGTGIVAQGVLFDDGSAALRWLSANTSTAVYASMADVEAIHGHAGKTRVVWTGDAFRRAMIDAIQDGSENAPFASVGGLESRQKLKLPRYISPTEESEYLGGYELQSELNYGKDWRTCEFGWGRAITIGVD